MVFWGQIQNYMMRANLNFLIVTMVNKSSVMTKLSPSNDSDIAQRCHVKLDNNALNNTLSTGVVEDLTSTPGAFEWDAWQRAIILGANSYGYLCTQIIGGRLTEIYGVKRIYGFGLLGSGILTAISPLAAYQHPNLLVAVRVGIGLLTGVTFPSLHAMTARWVPVERRSRFISRSYFGSTFGLIITFPMCAFIVSWWNWEGAFYVISLITTVWFVIWWMLVFDSPQDHPRISSDELEYLTASIGREAGSEKNHPPVPWISIITSIPFWGILMTDMANTFGIVVLASNGPTYLSFMLNLNLGLNAIVSGLPMMCRYFGGVLLSLLSDGLISKNMLSVTNTRRIFNSISQLTPAICMACLYFAQCDWLGVLILLCVGMFFNGALSSGHFSSHVDLAPNFAGTLLGISNTFSGGLMGFVAPLAVAAITEEMTLSSWTILFSLTAIIYVIGNIFYVVLISGETQSWNYPNRTRQSAENDLASIPLKA